MREVVSQMDKEGNVRLHLRYPTSSQKIMPSLQIITSWERLSSTHYPGATPPPLFHLNLLCRIFFWSYVPRIKSVNTTKTHLWLLSGMSSTNPNIISAILLELQVGVRSISTAMDSILCSWQTILSPEHRAQVSRRPGQEPPCWPEEAPTDCRVLWSTH